MAGRAARARGAAAAESRQAPLVSGGLGWTLWETRRHPAVELRCYVLGGSIAEWPNPGSGAGHLLEHVIATELAQRSHAEGLAALLTATTHRDHTCFGMKVEPRDAIAALVVLLSTLVWQDLESSVVEQHRQVILEELRRRARPPFARLRQAFLASSFGEHPMASPVGGDPEGLRDLSLGCLEDYRSRCYGASNLHIVVVGAFDSGRAQQALETAARFLPAGQRFTLPRRQWKLPSEHHLFEIVSPCELAGPRGTPLAYTEIGFPVLGADRHGLWALHRLSEEVNRNPSGDLRASLIDSGAAYDLTATLITTAFGVGAFSLLVEHPPERAAEVVLRVSNWLVRVGAGEVHLDANGSRRTDLLLGEEAEVLGLRALGRPFVELEGWHPPEGGAALAAALRHQLDCAQPLIGHLWPPAGRPALHALPSPPWRSTSPPEKRLPGVVERVNRRRRLFRRRQVSPVRSTPIYRQLDNGVRLLALPTPSPISCFHLLLRAGVSWESQEFHGVTHLLSRGFAEALPRRLPEAHRALLEHPSTCWLTFADWSFLGATLAAPSTELPAILPTLASLVALPSLEPELLLRARAAALAELSPAPVSWPMTPIIRLRELLLDGHPQGRAPMGSAAQVATWTDADITEALKELCWGKNLVAVLAGSAATGGMLDELSLALEKVPPGSLRTTVSPALLPGPRSASVTSSAAQDWLALGFAGIALDSLDDFYALELAKTLLVGPQGATATGWVVEQARAAGLAYQVECVNLPGFGQGIFALAMSYSRGQRSRSQTLIEAAIDRLRRGKLSPEALRLAAKSYCLHHALLEEVPRRQAFLAARLLLHSGDPRSWERLPEDVTRLDVDRIATTTRRLFAESAQGVVLSRPADCQSVPRILI